LFAAFSLLMAAECSDIAVFAAWCGIVIFALD
jgi:hypothetical protein